MGVHALYTAAEISKGITVVVHSRTGFTEAEVIKHETSMKMLQTVLNSFQFRERMMALKLSRTNGMTNAQIYELIRNGREILSSEDDGEIDIWVEAYHENNNVVGYTKPSTVKTWLNRKFFTFYEYAEVACNAFHEWLHKLGFDHISAKDHSSVPYALGYLVRDMIRELVAGAVFTPITQLPLPVELPTRFPEPKRVLVCRRSWRTFWIRKICSWEVV